MHGQIENNVTCNSQFELSLKLKIAFSDYRLYRDVGMSFKNNFF